MGPKRSGTSVHVDPLGTSAWNTVIKGRKLWVLFPPRVDKRIVKGKDLIKDDEDDEPVRKGGLDRFTESLKAQLVQSVFSGDPTRVDVDTTFRSNTLRHRHPGYHPQESFYVSYTRELSITMINEGGTAFLDA